MWNGGLRNDDADAILSRLSSATLRATLHLPLPCTPRFHLQPEPKTAVKTLKQLSSRFNYLASAKDRAKKQIQTDDLVGEWANVMEQEYYDFVLFEIPKVDF